MREILFRGKCADNGEWVEGSYYHQTKFYGDDWDEHYIISSCDELEDNMMWYDEVIPETVGQYTGLTDKNGKKIFEGDIFLHDNETTYLVKWDCEYCGFYSEAVGDYNNYDYLGNFYNHLCEVIGNIHDIPELLEVDNGKID